MHCECGCGQEIPAKHLFRYKPPYLLRGHRLETPLCACGCGARTPWSPNLRYQRRVGFIKGHAKRKTVVAQPCECGCGQMATAQRGVVRRFISGHNRSRLGSTVSPETRAVLAEAATTHGLSKSPTYITWVSMQGRCYDPANASYPQYGARGITVCDRWMIRTGGSFENFLADMGPRPAGMTLDRIDGTGNYEPANCRWTTRELQNANRPADNGWNKRRDHQPAPLTRRRASASSE